MRNFQFFAVLAAFTLSGCGIVLEDESNCPPPLDRNLTLRFSNTDDRGNEIFSDVIDKVEIFLFNESDRLVYRFDAPQAELVASKSASVKVAPGIYRVVCWANVKGNSTISLNMGGHIDNGYVFKHASAGDAVVNGDPLYYAPFDRLTPQTFTVVKDEQKIVGVKFRAAHIKMDFTVKDYITATGATALPYIEIANLYPKYDFVMGYLPTAPQNYIQQTSLTPATRAGDMSYCMFYTPRFENDNPIVISLRKDISSPIIKSFILKDELAIRGIDLSTSIELTIPFVFTFSSDGFVVDVNMEIGNWNPNPLDPDLQ